MIGRFFRWLWRYTTEADETYYSTVGTYADEPYSRKQIDRMAAEQGVRYPHSKGPHTVG